MTIDACERCLRRTDLIAALAGRIEVEWNARDRRSRILALSDQELLEWSGSPTLRERYEDFSAAAARAAIGGAGLSALCRCADAYPQALRDLPDPPAVLHAAGSWAALGPPAAAVVGARKASAYGITVAHSLGRGLCASEVTVVSGMALGVDSEAHAGALEVAPRTVAVLGSGADRAYPARKRSLHGRIIRERGLVLSELPPGFSPLRWTFPARNRIIAALSSCTVVVEATERSGSLITADLAADLGRVVGAVPGPVTSPASAGTNLLIRSGAEVVRCTQDVLDLLFGAGGRVASDPAAAALSREHADLLDRVRRGARSVPELLRPNEDAMAIAAGLAELELRGLLRRGFDGRYTATVV